MINKWEKPNVWFVEAIKLSRNIIIAANISTLSISGKLSKGVIIKGKLNE